MATDPMYDLVQSMMEARQGPRDEEEELMRLAGDVVPIYKNMPTEQMRQLRERMTTPGTYMGSRGATSIGQFGGRQSPYLDLMDVLMFPSGRPADRR